MAYKLTLVVSFHEPKQVGIFEDMEALKAGAKQVFEKYNWPAGGYWVDFDYTEADISEGPVCLAAAHPFDMGGRNVVAYLLEAEKV